MQQFVPEGTVFEESGVPDGESAGEAAAHIHEVQVRRDENRTLLLIFNT